MINLAEIGLFAKLYLVTVQDWGDYCKEKGNYEAQGGHQGPRVTHREATIFIIGIICG